VPLSGLQRSLATCAIVLAIKVRREQYVPRERSTRGLSHRDSRVCYNNNHPTVIRDVWNVRLLRAPPLSSIA